MRRVIAAGFLLWLLFGGKAGADEADDDDDDDDADDDDDITIINIPPGLILTPKQIYDQNVVRRPQRPRVGAGYEIKSDGMTSLSQVAGAALSDWLAERGETMHPTQHIAYGRQLSMVKTSFRLYGAAVGVQDQSYGVQVPNADGTVNPLASIASAFLPMHDPWDSEMMIPRPVARLISFHRGSQGQVQPKGNWGDLIAPGRSRTYGTIWVPEPHPLALSGVAPPAGEVVNDPKYDWPANLWVALGVERATVR